MKWTMKIQKLGRIQIPTGYLKAYNLKEGDIVTIEEKANKLIISFKRKQIKSKT
jgi:bifunctional DNA-binding transcriptional regulator/antitoxin component of YhaV-PrlF toxin-antitoxin module